MPGYREQVFHHDLHADTQVQALVTNQRLGIEFSLGFSSSTLPYLHQWKMVGQGAYVLGIEPSNCRNLLGRSAARAAGEMPVIGAGESVGYRLEFRLRRIAPAAST